MQNAGLCEAQTGIKIAGRNINNLRYADVTTLMAESEEELRPLDEGERGEQKTWLKTQSKNEDHGIWSHYFMANRLGNNGNSDRLYFVCSKIIADGDCSHEIKRSFSLEVKLRTTSTVYIYIFILFFNFTILYWFCHIST